jgi:hypothetical protein
MKIGVRTLMRTLMFVPLIGLIGVTQAHAQVTETMRFQTTFPFTVGEITYPAGTYTIRPANDQANIMEISSGTKATIFTVDFEKAGPNRQVQDQVVFNKYGDQYVLSQIWDTADRSGAKLEATSVERRLAEQRGSATTESVAASRDASHQGRSARLPRTRS